MSERTGATDAQIEAAARERYNDINSYYGNEWNDRQTGIARHIAIRHMEQYAEYLVPPGMVIARAADVLTTEQRAAIGRLWNWAKAESDGGYDIEPETEADFAILRAIAEGGTE